MRIQTEDAEQQARWIEKPLDQCALIQTGVSKGRKMSPETLISVPYLRVANVQDGYLDLSEIKEIHVRPKEVPRYALQCGDVLLTEGGDFDKLGRGFVWNGELPECIHQNHVFAVRVDQSQLDPHFFAYQAQSPHGKQYFLSVAHKTTNLACINTTKLKAFPVRIPPLSEQKEIVHILSTVQHAIKAQERIIQTTTELKKALMQKLFSEGLRGEPQKETEIGLVPESWEVNRFDSFAVLQRGFDITKKDQRDGEYPVVSSGGVSSYHNEAKVKGPGVVIGRKGSLGTVYYVPSDFWPHDTTLWVKEFKGNSPRFIAYLLEIMQLKRFDTGAANPTLNRNIVHGEKISIPPKDQQIEIWKALDTVEEKLLVHAGRKHSLQDLLQALLHNLMSVRIRTKVP
jgi:type I restriction enzyme S subunit